jgi:large subunit ribosomal protein L9
MDILLLEDVYNLGRAGDVKKVANGYGRNFLIPQGMALPATPGAVAQAEQIAEDANKRRNVLNEELKSVAEKIEEMQLQFPARAGETGKLYGSVTTQMMADALAAELGQEIDKRQIHGQPLRLLGMHTVAVRLTIDLIPEFSVVVFREGENAENYMIAAEELAAQTEDAIVEVEEAAEDVEDGAEAEMELDTDAVAEMSAAEEEVEEVAEGDEEGETAEE